MEVYSLTNSERCAYALPLAAGWNSGTQPNGYHPMYQSQVIDQGAHVLPWYSLKKPGDILPDGYYEQIHPELPISFISTQWESLLYTESEYFDLPPDENPNVVGTDGTIQKRLSPFGPISLWKEVGAKWASSQYLKDLQDRYPDPPLVLFISNNESKKLRWLSVEDDYRYLELYGDGQSDEFKRKVIGDAWIERYRALQAGIREGLTQSKWRTNCKFIGYNAFGSSAFGRWGGWLDYSLYTEGRFEPWPLAWDGATVPYYVHNWDPTTDYRVWSPQVQAMNWVFMLEEAKRMNPNFWFELSIWDGHDPGKDDDMYLYYTEHGQTYTPERYGGLAKFGLWLLRPRVLREFRGHTQTVNATESYFMQLVDVVGEIHGSTELQEFWKYGVLVENTAEGHPYNRKIPDEYSEAKRWFLLDVDINESPPWELDTEVPVFALALRLGTPPNRRWLVYTFSPTQVRCAVRVLLPEVGEVAVSATPEGTYHIVHEQS